MKILKPLAAVAVTAAALWAAPGLAATYIKTTTGHVLPKHECDPTDKRPCVDCTFLDYQTCYDKADRAGLVNKNVGFGPGMRPPVVLGRPEKPLEMECNPRDAYTTTSYIGAKGTIICPVKGAVATEAPVQPKRVADPWLPPENPGGEAAIGTFFAQYCPGYITDDARRLIHTISQMRAREAWQPYNDIKAKIADATRANQTSGAKELQMWCIAAEPRIAAIQDKLGQAIK